MFHLGCQIPVQGRFFFRFLVLWGSTDAHYAPRGAGGVIGEENSAPCSEGVSWYGILLALQGEFCTGLARKVASGDSYGPVGTRKDAYLAVVVPGVTRTEAGRTTVVPPQPPPTSRAPALRERGKPATASCQKRTRTPRRRTMQNG